SVMSRLLEPWVGKTKRTERRIALDGPGAVLSVANIGCHGPGRSPQSPYYPGKEENHVGRIFNPSLTGRIENPSYDLSCRGNIFSRFVRKHFLYHAAQESIRGV